MGTDEELMLAYQAGDNAAFVAVFDRYRDAVWRFFRRRVADEQQAEELTQETFLAVVEAARRYEARASFRSYLFGIAFNVLAAWRRRGHRDVFTVVDGVNLHAQVPDPNAVIWVQEAPRELDGPDRELLMAVPIGTIRSRLFRARTALKERLLGDREGKGVRP